jgi:transcriptional regulator with XRE-family HTH domain
MPMKTHDPKFRSSFERGLLRSAFRSLFWAVITERKKKSDFKLVDLARAVAASKHEVSRWFNGDPNWTINTIANIANALNVDVRIEAVDRTSGQVFTPAGAIAAAPRAWTRLGDDVQRGNDLPQANPRIVRGPAPFNKPNSDPDQTAMAA